MKKWNSILSAGAAVSCLAVAIAFVNGGTAMAAGKVNTVRLEVSSDIVSGDSDSSVEVTADNSRYSVTEVTVTNQPDFEWEGGDKPKIRVIVEPDDGYSFKSGFGKNDVTISGSYHSFTVNRNNAQKITVNITLEALNDGEHDLEVTGLEWGDDGFGYWNDAYDANKYEVRLFRAGVEVSSVLTTTNTEFDFSKYFTKSGTYTFRVRGVYNSSNKGAWYESGKRSLSTSDIKELKDEYNESRSTENSSSGSGGSKTGGPGKGNQEGWQQDQAGWWYRYSDGSYAVNGWAELSYNGASQWYHFNLQGYVDGGWLVDGGHTYYLSPLHDGTYGMMVTGWREIDGRMYYFHPETGGPKGAMLRNASTPDGHYVGSDGAMVR